MSNPSNTPWTESIRRGDFRQAEEEISQAVGQRLIPQLANAYAADQINNAVAQINQNYQGPAARYTIPQAQQRVNELAQSGKIQTPQQYVTEYQKALDRETQAFNSTWKDASRTHESIRLNGGVLNTYNSSDEEKLDYIAERRAEQQRLKSEGLRIATLPSK